MREVFRVYITADFDDNCEITEVLMMFHNANLYVLFKE